MANVEQTEKTLELFDLEPEGRTSFVVRGGQPRRRLFGGQVAGQAYVAAARTVPAESGQALHSLHGYFLRPGRGGVPIRYAVHALKDGRNFSARDVVASQGEEVIFTLHASFTRPESGISHLEVPMPEAPDPETLAGPRARLLSMAPAAGPGGPEPAGPGPDEVARWLEGPVLLRACDPEPTDGERRTSLRRLWIRPRDPLPDDPVLHTALVIWVSDRSLLRTGSRPHGHLQRRAAASLDHGMWFHREFRFDDWWLYVMESPVAHNARAFIQGAMYRRDGSRVLSVAQEGLIRS